MKKESCLFTPINIGKLTIPNRFVRSATHDFMAGPIGEVTDRQVALFQKLTQGEVGLIITGHAYVHPYGKASLYQMGVENDSRIEDLKKISHAVRNSPSRIFLQIAHAGRQTKEKLCGCKPLAPSPVYEPVFKIKPKEMSLAEIEEVVSFFIQAGRRAREADFDGIQLHVAHGYLLSGFISPYTNLRIDDYGGSIANRARIVTEIIQGIKTQVDKDFPLIVKLNGTDSLKGGLSLEESIQTAKILETAGADGIEVSGGMAESGEGSIWKGLRSEKDEGYFVRYADRVKKKVRVPVFGLGGIRSFAQMERIIRMGQADLISMSRPFIRQPFLVREFRLGRYKKSDCISCNKCLNPRGIVCGDLKPSQKKQKG